MLKKLVLFDIDGTLLTMGAINRSVLVDALQEVYGTPGSANTCNFAGKMDSNIIYETMQSAGLSNAVQKLMNFLISLINRIGFYD